MDFCSAVPKVAKYNELWVEICTYAHDLALRRWKIISTLQSFVFMTLFFFISFVHFRTHAKPYRYISLLHTHWKRAVYVSVCWYAVSEDNYNKNKFAQNLKFESFRILWCAPQFFGFCAFQMISSIFFLQKCQWGTFADR